MRKSGREARLRRYDDFSYFYTEAKGRFAEITKGNEIHGCFVRTHQFYVIPGGRDGGSDSRLVDVFFGQNLFGTVSIGRRPGMPASSVSHSLFEHGVFLRYFRQSNGFITCILYPATTEDLKRRESSIILARGLDPKLLNAGGTLRKHWKIALSYFELSSVDGSPRLMDWVCAEWVTFTRPLVVDDVSQEVRAISAAKNIIKWSLTVGLSGALLKLIF